MAAHCHATRCKSNGRGSVYRRSHCTCRPCCANGYVFDVRGIATIVLYGSDDGSHGRLLMRMLFFRVQDILETKRLTHLFRAASYLWYP